MFRDIIFGMFSMLRKQVSSANPTPLAAESRTEEKPTIEHYAADSPLDDPSQDRFGRLEFARRIAETIAVRRDPQSIVFAISGAYGEGKTTVLHYIEGSLKGRPDVVCVSFNPWRFTTDEALLRGFFATLAQALGKSMLGRKEKIGDALSKYGALATELVKVKYQDVEISPGSGVQSLGEWLSSTTIEESKQRVDEILTSERKRVVVLMDDIDRLERREIQIVFRLIKLTADFPYTAYVLAFDQEMVAGAVGERYGKGDIQAGREFLEKIIQVPLQLPKAPHDQLVEYCLSHVQAALDSTEQQLTDKQTQDFQVSFLLYVAPRLETPRNAKRYANALAFVLPLLRDELAPVDVMLLEAVKIFYPDTFEHLRDQPQLYTGYYPFIEIGEATVREQRAREAIDDRLKDLSSRDRELARELLGRLFPQVRELWRTGHYGQRDRENWDVDQRVASHTYLVRYLSWSVPLNDFSDRALQTLLETIEAATDELAITEVRDVIAPGTLTSFLDKIVVRLSIVGPPAALKLALGLAGNGDLFPNQLGQSIMITPRRRVAVIIAQLVKRQPLQDQDLPVLAILQLAHPLPLAWWCWSYLHPQDHEIGLDHARLVQLAAIVVNRTKEEARQESLVERYPEDFCDLFHGWAIHGNPDEVKDYTTKLVGDNPLCAEKLVWVSFFRRHGLVIEFGELQYDDLAKIVNPSAIYSALVTVHPNLASGAGDLGLDDATKASILRQFAAIYRNRSLAS